ncbi:MAG: hypothetical protein ACOC80_04735 [Petrotogales bacterium]
MRKVVIFFLVVLLIGINSFSINWNIDRENHELTNYILFELNPGITLGNYKNDFVTKYNWGWGRPTNPGENVYYIQNELKPLINAVLHAKQAGLELEVHIPFQNEYGERLQKPSQLFSLNVPNLNEVDMNFPYLGYLKYEKDNWIISMGRFPLKWGWSKYPLTISPTTYQDNITFSAGFSNITYYFHAIASSPILSPAERDIQANFSDQHTPGIYYDESSKYVFAHRIEFDFDSFSFGLGELNVVGGKHPDIIDANPVVIFHNTYGEGYSNVLASFDLLYKLNENNRFYGEFSIDDYEASTEKGSGYKPTAYAYNLGGNLNFEYITLWFEYDYVSEWMYVTNYLSYLRVNVRQFHLNNGGSGRLLVDYPLGFEYGPDAKMFSAGINGKILDVDYSVVYNYLVKGTVIDEGETRWKWFWDTWTNNVAEDAPDPLPRGEDETANIITIKLDYKYFSGIYKTINLSQHFLGLYGKYSFAFGK